MLMSRLNNGVPPLNAKSADKDLKQTIDFLTYLEKKFIHCKYSQDSRPVWADDPPEDEQMSDPEQHVEVVNLDIAKKCLDFDPKVCIERIYAMNRDI